MAFKIPTLRELRDNALSFLRRGTLGTVSSDNQLLAVEQHLARENSKVLSFAIASAVQGNYEALSYIAKQAIPIDAEGEFLDGWLSSVGLQRKPATAASGTIRMGGISGSLIPAGTILQSGQYQYQVTTAVTIPNNGNVTVEVRATEAGSNQNQTAGSTLTLLASVSGVNGQATVLSLNNGTDKETDTQAQRRLQQRLSNPPLAGAPTDYERWALSVPGITRAWGLRTPHGACTAGVIIVADDRPDGLPTVADQQAVYNYIRDPDRAPPDDLYVIIPSLKKIDITLHLEPDNAANRAAVMLELKDLFHRRAEPGLSMPHTHLIEAVSIAPGEYTHRFDAPTITTGQIITTSRYEILALGTVTFV